MRRRIGTAASAIAAFMIGGCASSMNVSSYVQRGTDFTTYHSYAWGPADSRPVGDARLERNPFFNDHMQGAIDRELALRGLQQAPESPDLLVHYHANISERMDVDRLDPRAGYCTVGDCPSGIRYYEAGTLVVDVMDARTNRLVWRGWAQDNVERSLSDTDRLERQVGQAVARMMARFPRARMEQQAAGPASGR